LWPGPRNPSVQCLCWNAIPWARMSWAESIVARPQEPICAVPVLERYSLGKDELVRFAVGSIQQMRGFVPSEEEVQEGDKLPIAFKSQGVFLFDAESGERYA